MRSIEGKRGMPRPRPPFPTNAGLWEKPTVLNNVETLANISQIILKGSSWFANIGTVQGVSYVGLMVLLILNIFLFFRK